MVVENPNSQDKQQEKHMATIAAKNQKVQGIADIIFLLDATGSMASCINDVKENVARFLESLKNPENPQEVKPIRDWRAAVYGYRDVEADGADNWLVTNPFTRSPEEVRSQLAALVATGGGDEPEDLLDALNKIAELGESAKGGTEDAWKWRYHTQAARCVVVFTDATFHGCSEDGMAFVRRLASDSSKTGEDVVNAILQNKLRVSIYAPDFSGFGWHGYAKLDDAVDKLEYEAIPIASDNDPQRALAEFTGDKAHFKKTLEQLAKSVSASAEAETLDESESVDAADGGSPSGTPDAFVESSDMGMGAFPSEAPPDC